MVYICYFAAQKPCTCWHTLLSDIEDMCWVCHGSTAVPVCCCRLWKQAYYNANNCEALVSCAAELQGLVLTNSSLAARPTLMANLLEAVTEVKEFVATFSSR